MYGRNCVQTCDSCGNTDPVSRYEFTFISRGHILCPSCSIKLNNYVGIDNLKKALQLNFVPTYKQADKPRFDKGKRSIWAILPIGHWQTADLESGLWINQQCFNNLSDALDRELTK